MDSKRLRWYFATLTIAGLIVLAWVFFVPLNPLTDLSVATRVFDQQFQWEPSLLDYEILEISSQFQNLWMTSNNFIFETDYGSNLISFDDKLFFVGGFDTQDIPKLHRINLLTGLPDWQIQQKVSSPAVIAHNSKYVFVGSDVPGQITAYDAESGTKVWERFFPITMKSVHYLYATTTELYINISPGQFDILDVETGETKQLEHSTGTFPIFFINNGTTYHQTLPSHLQAANETGIVLWEVNLDDDIVQMPLLMDGTILVRTGEKALGQIFAFEEKTGRLQWHSKQDVASNVTVDNSIVYFLTRQSQLNALDIKTGKVLGVVEFTPSLLELDIQDLSNRKFYVAASDNIVTVYFGSSRQLFAFRFSPGE